MAGEATVSGSQAALKVLYPDGGIPKSIQKQFVLLNRLKKETDFVGELMYVPINNANPQGSSAIFASAQANIAQSNFVRFALTRVKHYGIARVSGEAAEVAVKSEGAMVDLWENETKGVAMTEMSTLATYLYGNGSGALAQIKSGSSVSGTSLTLADTANMNYFELNQTIGSQTTDAVTATVNSGSQKITAIDRKARTITGASNWNSAVSGIANTDYVIRAGDSPVSSAANVITGLKAYVEGGSSPAALFGLTRSTDPVRLAGQTGDYTGWDMGDAVVDASSLVGFQGIGYPDLLVANNIEIAAMKRTLGAKITYQRDGSAGQDTAGVHSFSKLVIEGEAGPIEVLADPFCPRQVAFLLKLDEFSLFSSKQAPHLQDFDGLKFLRRPDEDTLEARFATYGNLKCKNPGPHFRLTGFGA